MKQDAGIDIIAVPSNLGLRPLRPGHVPGTWRAPECLLAAGLYDAVAARSVVQFERPDYSPEPRPGTGLYNGDTLRALGLELANTVTGVIERGNFPLVVGGDCSILLGALAGARRSGALALIHLDGHSDFRHPGNYDSKATLGAAAGMDLALATGRGEPMLTEWPSIDGPLVPDHLVIQIGEREGRDPDYAWPDIAETAIDRIDIFEANAIGAAAVALRLLHWTESHGLKSWVHLDFDVLDQHFMPAVDSPGSPGLSPEDLITIGGTLVQGGYCCGLTTTIYDPELDVGGRCAKLIVEILGAILLPIGARVNLQ